MINVYESVDNNKRKSILVVSIFVVFVLSASYVIGKAMGFGSGFVGFALILSGLMTLASYYWSDKIILGISNAKPVNLKTEPVLQSVTENLSMAARLPMPRLYVIEDTAPNAFATGRDPEHGVLCVTRGLLDKLNRTELEGVIGHELSHIGNYDTRLLAVVTILVGMIALLGDWFLRSLWFGGSRDRDEGNRGSALFFILALVLAIISPILAQLIQLAVSRRRELLADASSVKLTRQPDALIKALTKISSDREPLEAANRATASLYIINPLKGSEAVGWFAGLWNTHPPIGERIKALQAMQ
ncbi:MAG: Protease HtpX-like protein [Microgenomates group bacterium GW2011_GWB1_44_8]|uniref:Protease HtpX homolog n=1 Tax=Candidatus Woesebacteria bacterium GW2011_GWA1_43_12 TaxID=1618557 RepID=A0A0G1FUS0_9BACT|nr:MAG: Protease HtpX-like protein [Candidatus Woesebacteria bacterium GW2011_GWA1_43_12]KKT78493.1 MAG: Protease HtpX-like protein [Microgenomates group bacterium GW2011_GWB1_44_8]